MKPTINKVHCLFEQSGTWKRAFADFGIPAFDYDIENQFGKTDYQIDIFESINETYDYVIGQNDSGLSLLFRLMDIKKDLIIAFFPCTYFCEVNMMYFTADTVNYRGMAKKDILPRIMERANRQNEYYQLLLKFCYIVEQLKIRCIIENPYSPLHFLTNHFPYKEYIDKKRSSRGDYMDKPTRYYFLNCEPYQLQTYQKPDKIIKQRSMNHGIERSLMSVDYAKNFISDVIFGETSGKITQTALNFA